MIILKSARELEWMREAGRVVAETLAELEKAVTPGITTGELDRIAEEAIVSRGALPAFKGYRGFPASICASINEEVVHGIPGLRKLMDGDIISIDVGSIVNGYYGDAALTFPVGGVSPELKKLLQVTRKALEEGIAKAMEGNRLSDISYAVQQEVEKNGFSVVRDYVGHGIGKDMHEEPQIPNFGRPGRGPRLHEGMVLAIEPMVNIGTFEVETLSDHWTVVTRDRKPSAHFEHTVIVQQEAPAVITSFVSRVR